MLAEDFRQLRLERFLAQAELGRPRQHALTIRRLEAGRTAPSRRTVRRLANVLGVAPGALVTPREVVQLRRVLRQDGRGGERPDSANNGGTPSAVQRPTG